MIYSEFVKKHYDSVKHLPAKDRFKAIAEMYHAQKGGKGMMMDDKKPKHSKAHSKAKGGLIVGGSEVPLHGGLVVGGALKRGRKAHGGMIVGGSEPSSPMSAHSMDRDILGLRGMSMMF
jgi:hypothetical protein